ncbi:1,4-dihydroxy-6-naphthoate synthase [Candidatus Oleimmundimicrobium sp.]|uniref:1,4-dihydroxy-6-naphthoate synthase n=1 Tax=Candidatus Oleimmundimicrobium sp. TaxID=3060597 RepID=UPI002725EAD9|nr:1,4-dihydroxy-6-naphthoate synthase [Candidatus Oleimmundimicrobium sp.]MDO8885906.1 1,4-dihydroxy-6-naphthoate synthase [Candidatus Oleimmundimicrobium sp.]
MKPITIGFSTCPNDTFIFYPLMKKKVNDCELSFVETLADVETLNKAAFNCKFDVTKLSYQAFGHLVDDYVLLRSGSALGRGCGPLLVSHHSLAPEELIDKKIAIPGKYTTAAMLFKLYSNQCKNLVEMSFEKIMPAIKEGIVDAGVIIHEGRFTYKKEGLVKVVDLGNWWEKKTGLPIPLGGIFAKRSLGKETIGRIDSCIKKSVEYAFLHREESMEYIKEYARELEDDVIKQHIELYVNRFSVDLGEEGVRAIKYLLKMGYEKNIFKTYREDFIV